MTTENTPTIPNLPSNASLTQRSSGAWALRCPYEENLPAALKRLGGTWDGGKKVWVIPADSLKKLDEMFARRAKAANSPEAVARRDAEQRKVAVTWLGYVEEAAREGRLYENGVKKLRGELNIARWPELVERLDKAIANARQTRQGMEAGWAAEKAAKKAEGDRKHAEAAAHRDLFPVENLPALNTPVRRGNAVVVYTGTGRAWYLSGEDGDGWASPDCWDTQVAYAYWREATEAEITALVEREADAAALRQVASAQRQRITDAIQRITDANDRPEHPEVAGEEVANTRNIYGGGHRIVVGADWIWYVQGNGADGADWSANNLPGEIAWRAPYSDELAAAIVGGSIM